MASPPGAPRLTLQQYASLKAELSIYPNREPEILVRYHVFDASAWQALEREWRGRFEADPTLHARWQELASRYRAWLLQRGG
jgi:hypothetical protein